MQTNLYTIGGIELSAAEIVIFSSMLDSDDHTYLPELSPDDRTREALDMLVLEGLIERFKSLDGEWVNGWVITDGALDWLGSAEQADMELIKAASTLCAQA